MQKLEDEIMQLVCKFGMTCYRWSVSSTQDDWLAGGDAVVDIHQLLDQIQEKIHDLVLQVDHSNLVVEAAKEKIEELSKAEPAAVAVGDEPLAVRTAPKKIWLDLGDEEAGDCDFDDLQEVTWSSANASGYGIEDVRAAIATTPEVQQEPVADEVIYRWQAIDYSGYCYGSNPPDDLPARCNLTAFYRQPDAFRAALHEISATGNLTATDLQFSRHLQKIACAALSATPETVNQSLTVEAEVQGALL